MKERARRGIKTALKRHRLIVPPKSICIVRLSALGDVTHMLPVIHTLRRHWPETKITWIIGKLEHGLLGNLPDVEFILFDKSKGLRAYHRIRKKLKGRRFDALLLMQVAIKANILGWLVHAKRKIGYDPVRSKDLHGLFIKERIPALPRQHVVDSFFCFIEKLGLDKKEWEWTLPPIPGTDKLAQEILVDDRPTMIISPCSSHELRNWRADRYAAMADYAAQMYHMQIIICGGPTQIEKEMARKILHHCKTANPINLLGKDTFAQIIELLKGATVLLSPDSGPMHMAAITDTPVIGLHAASNPLRSGPYKSLEYCVDRYDQAAIQYLGKPSAQIKWGTKIEKPGVMDLISVSQVKEKLDKLMKTLQE